MLSSLIILAISGTLILAAPSLTVRRYYFGFSVAPGFPESDIGRAIRRGYFLSVAAAMLLAAVMILAIPAILPLAMFIVPFTGITAFLYFRGRVRDFSTPASSIREAVITQEGERLPTWTLLALPPFAVPIEVGAYLHAHWDLIPVKFPVHWAANGEANRWIFRSYTGVYGPLWFGAAVLMLMVFLGLTTFYGSRRSPARGAVMKSLVTLMYLIAWVFGMVGLLALHRLSPLTLIIPALMFLVPLLTFRSKAPANETVLPDAASESCWRLSLIYNNPDDPVLFVDVRFGRGYTLNFGNPLSWLVVAAVLVVIPGMLLMLR
jgi:uncharacterized membrane protein